MLPPPVELCSYWTYADSKGGSEGLADDAGAVTRPPRHQPAAAVAPASDSPAHTQPPSLLPPAAGRQGSTAQRASRGNAGARRPLLHGHRHPAHQHGGCYEIHGQRRTFQGGRPGRRHWAREESHCDREHRHITPLRHGCGAAPISAAEFRWVCAPRGPPDLVPICRSGICTQY